MTRSPHKIRHACRALSNRWRSGSSHSSRSSSRTCVVEAPPTEPIDGRGRPDRSAGRCHLYRAGHAGSGGQVHREEAPVTVSYDHERREDRAGINYGAALPIALSLLQGRISVITVSHFRYYRTALALLSTLHLHNCKIRATIALLKIKCRHFWLSLAPRDRSLGGRGSVLITFHGIQPRRSSERSQWGGYR